MFSCDENASHGFDEFGILTSLVTRIAGNTRSAVRGASTPPRAAVSACGRGSIRRLVFFSILPGALYGALLAFAVPSDAWFIWLMLAGVGLNLLGYVEGVIFG